MQNQLFSDRWKTDAGRLATEAVLHALRTDDWVDAIFDFTGMSRGTHAFVLKGIDLGGRTLDGLDFGQLVLSHASFVGASMVNIDLQGCDLDGADFTDANLRSGQLAGCTARGASFKNADLTGCFAMSADFTAADFSGADLTSAALSATIAVRAEFNQTIFDRTDLDLANWRDAWIAPATWNEISVTGAILPTGPRIRHIDGGSSAAFAEVAHAAASRLPVLNQLTGRELAVLAMLTKGMSNKDVAKTLSLSMHTVLAHVRHIQKKIGATESGPVVLAKIAASRSDVG